MENVTTFKDLIRTIEDDEEVEDLSESSDVEVEFQPSKQIGKKNETFAEDFTFVSTEEEYNKDSWNDIKKYIKRKAKSKTDDKINKHRPKQNDEENNSDAEEKQDSGAELDLSDDELAHDRITARKKKILGKNKEEEEEPGNEQHFDGNNDIMNFQQMNLSRPLLKAISDMKFVHPTPIQCATIPVALLGRDICGCAATGTGKTAAYMLPTLERLLYRPTEATSLTRVLVLVPTRELGVQVYQVSKQLCQYTDIQLGLAVGGLDLKTQENILRKNPDIVIATPGRLIDHLKSTPTFGLDSIEVLILDEADRMLDEYFAEQMKEIIKQCSRTRQTMLFSATMTEEVENLAAVSLVDPVRLFVDSNKDVAFNLRQEFVRIRMSKDCFYVLLNKIEPPLEKARYSLEKGYCTKAAVCLRSGKEADREAILGALVCRTFRESCIIFVQTKKQAHRLHILLGLLGLKVAELHGNLTQPQRLEALEKFKNKSVDVLVATDVAARGLDIPGVKTVVNFVMPFLLEHYIHRVGRTARAGRAGVSVSLAGEQERKMVKDIIKRAKYPVKNRVIPPDIIEKYRQKITKLEPKITQILLEEEEERLLSKAENQANKMEKMLAGSKDPVRPWFQTKKERKSEKDHLKLKVNAGGKKVLKGKDKKGKGGQKPDPESEEIAKIAAVQARMVKKKIKQKKINAVRNEVGGGGGQAGGKKRKSHFEDLVNTKNAKKLRYQPKFQQNKRGNKKGKR